jgi:hypothetical protein
MPIMLVTQEPEIRKIANPRKELMSPISKKNHHKRGSGGVAEGIGSRYKTYKKQ